MELAYDVISICLHQYDGCVLESMHVIDVPITFRERGVKEKGILGETKSILWDLFEHQKNNHICWIYQSGMIDASPFLLCVCVCVYVSWFELDCWAVSIMASISIIWAMCCEACIYSLLRKEEKWNKTDILFGLAHASYDLRRHTQPKWETLEDILLEQIRREDGNYWLIGS